MLPPLLCVALLLVVLSLLQVAVIVNLYLTSIFTSNKSFDLSIRYLQEMASLDNNSVIIKIPTTEDRPSHSEVDVNQIELIKEDNEGTSTSDAINGSTLLLNGHIEDRPIKSRTQRYIDNVKNFIIKNYLPISLLTAVIIGCLLPQPGVALNHKATQYVCVIGIFMYSGLYLNTSTMKEMLHAYKATIWGIISILGVTTVIGGQLTSLLSFDDIRSTNLNISTTLANETIIMAKRDTGLGPAEFKTGLQVYFCMPCTISSGVVMVSLINIYFLYLL